MSATQLDQRHDWLRAGRQGFYSRQGRGILYSSQVETYLHMSPFCGDQTQGKIYSRNKCLISHTQCRIKTLRGPKAQ
jgi:hypothetical protein